MTNRREINTTIHFQHSHENNIHNCNSRPRPRPTHSRPHTLPSHTAAPAAHPFSAGPAAPARQAPDAPQTRPQRIYCLLRHTHGRPRPAIVGDAISGVHTAAVAGVPGQGSPDCTRASAVHTPIYTGGSCWYCPGVVLVLYFLPSLSLSPLYIDSKSYTQKCTPNTG